MARRKTTQPYVPNYDIKPVAQPVHANGNGHIPAVGTHKGRVLNPRPLTDVVNMEYEEIAKYLLTRFADVLDPVLDHVQESIPKNEDGEPVYRTPENVPDDVVAKVASNMRDAVDEMMDDIYRVLANRAEAQFRQWAEEVQGGDLVRPFVEDLANYSYISVFARDELRDLPDSVLQRVVTDQVASKAAELDFDLKRA